MIAPKRFGDLSLLLLIITLAIWAILGYNEQYVVAVLILLALSPLLFIYYLLKLERENADIYAYFYSTIYTIVAILIGAGLGNLSVFTRTTILIEGIVFALAIFILGLRFSIKVHGITRITQLLSKPLMLLVLVVSIFIISYVLTRIAKLGYSVSSPIVSLLMIIIPIIAYFGFYRGKF